MNYFNTKKEYHIAENIETLYTNLIEEKEKMTKEVCEKKLAIFNFILFGESFEVKVNNDEDELGKKDQKKSEETYSKEDKIDINLRTKIFILSCVENFLREWEINEVE